MHKFGIAEIAHNDEDVVIVNGNISILVLRRTNVSPVFFPSTFCLFFFFFFLSYRICRGHTRISTGICNQPQGMQ